MVIYNNTLWYTGVPENLDADAFEQTANTLAQIDAVLEKELLNFTLLSDENHQVCEQFGVWGEKSFMGKTYDGIHRISF
ncbi:redoxin domain-containing protein, partial [Salmonella enterica subsp. enterica serovar Anatum]|nr:redoxin domain-containing protein [Salmonella enterica subsp. enterica serovar Anatum]